MTSGKKWRPERIVWSVVNKRVLMIEKKITWLQRPHIRLLQITTGILELLECVIIPARWKGRDSIHISEQALFPDSNSSFRTRLDFELNEHEDIHTIYSCFTHLQTFSVRTMNLRQERIIISLLLTGHVFGFSLLFHDNFYHFLSLTGNNHGKN